MPPASLEDSDSDYSNVGIMAQIWVAFGQGTGTTRTSQKATLALHARYFEHIDKHRHEWGPNAVQVLERIRAIGTVAAYKELGRGDTTISEADVNEAIAAVEHESDSSWCPP